MKRALAFIAVILVATTSWAGDREDILERLHDSGIVLDEVMGAPDSGIPEEIFDSAECVAVVPSLLKAAFVFGGQWGKGVATCRTETGWSAPAFFQVTGGSWGLQIGGEAVDLIMMIMNQQGMKNLLSSQFKLGADASVAAGPVGRHASGNTDWKMRAQVLTYSRSRGIFAGLSLEGALIRQDKTDTRMFYGRMIPYRRLLGGKIDVPEDAQPFLSAVERHDQRRVAQASDIP